MAGSSEATPGTVASAGPAASGTPTTPVTPEAQTAGATPSPAPAQVGTPATPGGPAPAPEPDAQQQERQQKSLAWWQTRGQDEIRKREEAEAKATELEARLKEIEQGQQPPPLTTPPQPAQPGPGATASPRSFAECPTQEAANAYYQQRVAAINSWVDHPEGRIPPGWDHVMTAEERDDIVARLTNEGNARVSQIQQQRQAVQRPQAPRAAPPRTVTFEQAQAMAEAAAQRVFERRFPQALSEASAREFALENSLAGLAGETSGDFLKATTKCPDGRERTNQEAIEWFAGATGITDAFIAIQTVNPAGYKAELKRQALAEAKAELQRTGVGSPGVWPATPQEPQASAVVNENARRSGSRFEPAPG